MKKTVILVLALGFSILPATHASPKDDLKIFQDFFKKRFPKVKFGDFRDGIYALDKDRREAWKDWMDFEPPFTASVELGKKLFNEKFNNGKSYASCFKNGGIGIRQLYPIFDKKLGKVITLEAAINHCRVRNKEKAYPWKTGKLAAISAYMAFTSRGKKINITVSNDPRSLAIYERGKRHYYTKRGQLNFACADCHLHNSGNRIRAEILSPALGQVTHFPVWRRKWANAELAKGKSGPTHGLGTLHRRYSGCNKNIRAKPYKAQSDEYTALEYFQTYLNNGLKINGPGLRQ